MAHLSSLSFSGLKIEIQADAESDEFLSYKRIKYEHVMPLKEKAA
ncbi:MAG: hypothetical protein ACTFAL_16105 [Candidatus Electronema sp. V4]